MQKVVTSICEVGNIVKDPEVCPDAIAQYSPVFFDAISNYLMGKDRWCNEILGVCSNMKVDAEDLHDEVDKILSTKPESLKNDDFIDQMYDQMAAEIANGDTDREIIKAVHISDVHLDKEYSPGSQAKCDSFLCCRSKFGEPASGEPAAGEWGSN